LERPDTGKRGPTVLVEGAQGAVVTPDGTLRLLGGAAVDDGDLIRFDGGLLPSRLANADFVAVTGGGRLRLRKAGQSLSANLRLDFDYTGEAVELEDADVAVEGVVPYPDFEAGEVKGATALRLALRAGRLTTGATTASGIEANFRLTGV